MSGKKIVLLIFFSMIALSILFYKFQVKPLSEELSESFPDYYNLINPMTCDIPKNDSVINIAHIRKDGDKFEITCRFGPLHEGLDYQNSNNLDIFFGLIKKCDKSVLLIDDAVRKKGNCVFPIDNPIPDDLTDYYVVYFACSKYENTLPIISNECQKQITNLGETTFYSGTIAVVDINNKIFYV